MRQANSPRLTNGLKFYDPQTTWANLSTLTGSKAVQNSIRTTTCSQYHHRDFILAFDSTIPRSDIAVLAAFLEETVAKGTRYEEGESIAFGSMLLRVAVADDCLVLQEPDMRSIPISWKRGVTQSMKLTRLQRDITESFGLEKPLDFPPIQHSLLVGVDVTRDGGSFVLDRANAVDADSGWFVGRADSVLDYNDPANLRRLSVYQAILNWPGIAGFLALPPGFHVDWMGSSFHFTRNGAPLTIKKGSFVDVLGWGPQNTDS